MVSAATSGTFLFAQDVLLAAESAYEHEFTKPDVDWQASAKT